MKRFSRGLCCLNSKILKKTANGVFTCLLSTAFIFAPFPQGAISKADAAANGDRTLWLHFTHTGEEKKITFRRDGKYDPEGLKQLQWILRDWRRNQPTNMDPRLFDLVWSVYQEVGASQPIHVVSGFRSKVTNDSLRRRSRGVAKVSQHTAGKAMDFYIPGVPIRTLREIGLKMQVGGVGYYPGSKTPFVHMDTGRVRHWPRMTPNQIAALFPDGKTLHKDTQDHTGRRYAEALAEYNVRKTQVIQPLSRSKYTRIASAASPEKKKKSGGLLASLFNNGRTNSPEIPAATESPAPSRVARTTSSKPETPAETPKIIPNKPVTTPNVAEKPAIVTRPEPVAPPVPPVQPVIVETPQAAPSVIAAIPPAPRAVPSSVREQFAPAPSIVVASAPVPVGRPAQTPPAIAPQIVVAKTDAPVQNLPRAVDATTTAALTRKDFHVPTPQVVKNRLDAISDPTRLVLNDRLTKPTNPALPEASSTLAYAVATNPANALPQLDADEFNRRFGQITTPAAGDASAIPAREIKRLSAAERFAALEIQEQKPTFTLDDIGIKSKRRQLALRKSLGLIEAKEADAQNQSGAPIAVASLEPATALNGAQKSLDHKTPRASVPPADEPASPSPSTVAIEPRSLTNEPGAFGFAGERKTIVETLMTDASVTNEYDVEFTLPKPAHMPSLFMNPTRAYAGTFMPEPALNAASGLSGEVINVTPTIDFGRAVSTRLSWLSR